MMSIQRKHVGWAVLLGCVLLLLWVAFSRQAPAPVEQPVETKPVQTTGFKEVGMPLDAALMRITKKPFGIRVTPDSSPVSPERFTGVHTGVDFELFPGEEDVEVPVRAICSGTILQKEWMQGYGGTVVQSCTVHGAPVTVVYGHVSLSSVHERVGDMLTRGKKFALLGDGFSKDTDNERKHLHLGIHRGTAVVTKGYVANESDLADWMDVEELLK